jgi:RHS repeat-associated protein
LFCKLFEKGYYPFGMAMPNRGYFVENPYRYGFNGKETDNETGTQDYGMRIYDPKVGRFLSVDPLQKQYPWYTPYQFAGNTPIQAIDLDGLEEYSIHLKTYQDSKGETRFQIDRQEVDDGFWTSIGIAIRSGPNAKTNTSFIYKYNGQQIEILDPTKEKVLNFWRDVTPDNFEAIAKEQAWDRVKGVIIASTIDAATGAGRDYVNSKITSPKSSGSTPTQRTNAQATSANGGNTEAAAANNAAKPTITYEGKEYEVNATVPYKRPTNATNPAQRKAANQSGATCATCGTTEGPFVADHKTPLAIEHISTGTIDKKKMRSVDAVQSQCEGCSLDQSSKVRKASQQANQIIKKNQNGKSGK